MIKKRAIVFIDGNNLYNRLKDCYGIERLDLEPFCKHIIQDRGLIAIYYFATVFRIQVFTANKNIKKAAIDQGKLKTR
jgi:hypothetical protein